MKKVKFNGTNLVVDTTNKYSNGRIAIELNHARTKEPYYVASVNLPEINLEPNEVAIKDYSENEGIFEMLINEAVIENTYKTIQTGYVTLKIAKLL